MITDDKKSILERVNFFCAFFIWSDPMVWHVNVCAVCNFLDIFHFCKEMEWRGFILSPRFWFLITDDWMTQTSRYREDARVSKILVKVQAELYLLLTHLSTWFSCLHFVRSNAGFPVWRSRARMTKPLGTVSKSPPSLQPPPRARQLRQEPTRPIPMFPGRSHISYLSIAGLQTMSLMKVTGQTASYTE